MKPGRRLGEADIAKEQRIILQREHSLHGGNFWNRDELFAFAVQAKAPDLRRTAEQILDIKRLCGRHDSLDDRIARRHDRRRARELRFIERHPENFAARRIRARKQIERVIASDPRLLDLIAELRQLLPGSIRPEQVMRDIAAIAILDLGDDCFPVARSLQRDLGDPRKVFAGRISVARIRRPEFMKINLLIEIQIAIGPLALSRITRVVNSRAIRVPRRAAGGRRILHVRDRVRQRFPRRDLVKVQRPIFTAALRKRDRHHLAIERRHKPIDRRRALGIHRIRIEQHLFRFQIVGRGERHQHRLLLRRLEFHREQNARPRDERRIARRSFREPLRQCFLHHRPVRQLVEISACPRVLRIRPGFDFRRIVLLQPLIRIFDFDALILIRHRLLRRLRIRLGRRGIVKRQREQSADQKEEAFHFHGGRECPLRRRLGNGFQRKTLRAD